VLELAGAVEVVVQAFYGAKAACEALQVRGQVGTFLVHARICAGAGYIILGT